MGESCSAILFSMTSRREKSNEGRTMNLSLLLDLARNSNTIISTSFSVTVPTLFTNAKISPTVRICRLSYQGLMNQNFHRQQEYLKKKIIHFFFLSAKFQI